MKTLHKNLLVHMIKFVLLSFAFLVYILSAQSAHAATLKLSPETGVYTVGNTFTVRVVVNTQNKTINAADGQLTFNPRELSVVSATRASSIFSLWTEEPSFSNSAGTVSFGGGSPAGYSGAAGSVISVTFKALAAGTPKITFKSGSILAADGMGTNILTSMGSGAYTVGAQTATPEPEQVEYIAPANTPKAPTVTSSTHPDETLWYKETTAELSWALSSGVIAVRTLLDSSPSTIPTIVYDEPMTAKTIDELEEGESYFHIQLKNADGWGKVTHFRIGVDSKAPEAFTISEASSTDPTNPTKTLQFSYEDVSPVKEYLIQIDGGERVAYVDEKEDKKYTLPSLVPGHHTIVVEAKDSAGNLSVASYSFDIASFEKPQFTEYSDRLSVNTIPVIRGVTRPGASVEVFIKSNSGEEATYLVTANDTGAFTFIGEKGFGLGVYDISATAKDQYGAVSETSDVIRIVVEEPGYIRIGTMMIQALSVIIPLIALVLLMTFGIWYLWIRLAIWKRKVRKEVTEAESQLKIEIDDAVSNLDIKVSELRESRKGKLTKAETALIEQIELDLAEIRQKVRKEIVDIEDIVK